MPFRKFSLQLRASGPSIPHCGKATLCTFLVHFFAACEECSFSVHCRTAAMHANLDEETDVSTADSILNTARQRGERNGLPYAGAVTPREAFELLAALPNARLVDVRTNAERDWIGRVTLPETQHLWVQWNLYPGAVRNPEFLQQLSDAAAAGDTLLFLCRSGVRSRHAATLATENGYANCFDILEGFEGDKDAAGHRKTVNGWCHAGLPWLGA